MPIGSFKTSGIQITPILNSSADGCELCPRRCGARRSAGEVGYCGATNQLKVARAALHYWEEPPISGSAGSGTIFFANCPLRCVYCQNESISHGGFGAAISVERLARICLELADQGAWNINLVTATQYSEEVIAALALARHQGLQLPVIWNSSGYETVATLQRLRQTVDIWLLDFRYTTPHLARRYSQAPDYPEVASQALQAVLNQTAPYQLDSDGRLLSGIVVRFLLLPDQLEEAVAAVNQVFALAGDQVCYSLLSQYTPPTRRLPDFPELNQSVNRWQYELLVDHVLNMGITHSYMQEDGCDEASFIPAFDLSGVL